MRCETTSSVKECALRARSTHGVHHAIVEVNIVIGVVLGEVLVAHVVPLVVDAVIGLALSLIAHVVVVVFVVAILHRIFCIWRYTLYRSFDGERRLEGREELQLIVQKQVTRLSNDALGAAALTRALKRHSGEVQNREAVPASVPQQECLPSRASTLPHMCGTQSCTEASTSTRPPSRNE